MSDLHSLVIEACALMRHGEIESIQVPLPESFGGGFAELRLPEAMKVEDLSNVLLMLERRGVITRNREYARMCCGNERDEDGFCIHRPGHPIYVAP